MIQALISTLFLQVNAVDTLAAGKERVSDSIDVLTIVIILAAVFGLILTLRMFVMQKKKKGGND